MTKRDDQIQLALDKMGCTLRKTRASLHFPLNELGLTHSQMHILMLVRHTKHDLTAKELAAKLEVTPGAITQFVDNLIEKDLLQRSTQKDDRRAITILLTSKAHMMFDDFKKHYFEAIAPQFSALNNQELSTLISLLEKTTLVENEASC